MQDKETWQNKNPVASSERLSLLPHTVTNNSSLLKKGRVPKDKKGQSRANKSITIYGSLHIFLLFPSFPL